jgi:hypothetical protein
MAARNGTTDGSTTPLLGVLDTMYPMFRYVCMRALLLSGLEYRPRHLSKITVSQKNTGTDKKENNC